MLPASSASTAFGKLIPPAERGPDSRVPSGASLVRLPRPLLTAPLLCSLHTQISPAASTAIPKDSSIPPPVNPLAGDIAAPPGPSSVTALLKLAIHTFPLASSAIPVGSLKPPPLNVRANVQSLGAATNSSP